MKNKVTNKINYYLSMSMVEKSIGTYDYERVKLKQFNNYLRKNKIKYLEQITPDVINRYIFELKRTCITNTINKHLKLLRLFFRRINYDFDYLQQLNNLPEVTKEVEIIDYDILKELIKYTAAIDSNYKNNLLYQCLFFLLIDTGARASEILLIEKKYIDIEKNTITLTHTKNKDQRKVFITDELSKPFIKMMLDKNYNSKYLLYDKLKNRNASYNHIKYYLNKLKSIFKVPKLHAHLFRHTVATYWLENGADIYFVQKVLGHRNINQTVRYLHSSINYRKSVYEKVAFKL